MLPDPPRPGRGLTARVLGSADERSFFWLLGVFGVTHLTMNLVRPMVSYRALELGVEPHNLGLFAAAHSIGPLVVALSIGRLVDRRGEMAFVLLGSAGIALLTIALAVAPDVASVLVLFALLGLAHLVLVVSIQSLVARGSATSGYDRRFGHLAFSAAIGQLAGPAIAGVIAGEGSPEGTQASLLVGGVIGLLAVPMVAGIRRPPGPRPSAEAASEAALPLLTILRTPGVARAILASLTVLSALDILIIYLPALGEERGWSASLVGGLLAARAASSMVSRFFLGWLSDRFGRLLLLAASMGVAAVSLVALPFTTALPAVAILMLTSGFGLGIGQPLSMSWVAAEATPATRATALSVRVMGNRLGQVAIPVAAGNVAAFAGVGGVLAVTGALVGASLVAVVGQSRRGPSPARREGGRGSPVASARRGDGEPP